MTTSIRTSAPHLHQRSALRTWLATLRGMVAVSRQRRQLCRLDSHLLRDIGVTRAQACKEAAKPAWNAPRHWRI